MGSVLDAILSGEVSVIDDDTRRALDAEAKAFRSNEGDFEGIVPLNSSRAWAAGRLREMADQVDSGRVDAVAACALFGEQVAIDDDMSSGLFHWVSEEIFLQSRTRFALGGLLMEAGHRLLGFVQWGDLEDEEV